jgi:uncharacterized protein (DUF433 family)
MGDAGLTVGSSGFVTIKGTRIRVKDLVAQYQSALDEIVEGVLRSYFPQLSSDQVKIALTYWREHPDKIEDEIQRESAEFSSLTA